MNSRQFLGIIVLLLGFIALGVVAPTVPQEHNPDKPQHTLYTYSHDILPLLHANCNPCHFPGGKMYKKLPFDDSLTVAKLGKKLNTRLKQKDQQTIVNGWVELQKR